MPEGATLYECGNCLVRSLCEPDGICGCGIHLGLTAPLLRDRKALRQASATRPGPRFRCVPNPARSVASPSVIVIAFGDPAP